MKHPLSKMTEGIRYAMQALVVEHWANTLRQRGLMSARRYREVVRLIRAWAQVEED